MTSKEAVEAIRLKNPQLSNLSDADLLSASIRQDPSRAKTITDYNPSAVAPKPVQNKPQASLPVKKQAEPFNLGEFGKGVIKRAGNTVASMVDMLPTAVKGAGFALNPLQSVINKATGVKNPLENVARKISTSKPVEEAKKHLDYNNKSQRLGGYAETAGEILLSGGTKAGSKILADTVGTVAGKLEKNAIKKLDPKKIKNTVSEIIQDKKANLPKAKDVLTSIKTKGVKTYEDLRKAIEDKTTELVTEVDNHLATNPQKYKIDDLGFSQKVGEAELKTNYVGNALNHLQETYTKSGDVVGAERIKQLTAKATNEGLSSSEINKLAREYGSEFGSKAFSKTGEPLTSVNAQLAENTRTGVKNTLKKLNPDSPIGTIDKAISQNIKVKQMVGKMEENVRALTAKIKKENSLMKFGRFVGKGAGRLVNTGLAGAPREFLTSFLPSNIGNKTMNSLDIEAALAKNLKKLEELSKLDLKEVSKSQLRKIENFLNNLYK
jgi:hypothetical protein